MKKDAINFVYESAYYGDRTKSIMRSKNQVFTDTQIVISRSINEIKTETEQQQI